MRRQDDINFTVVTPVLNGAPLLAECIASVQRERHGGARIEHIVLDGGSTDGSPELARALGTRVIERPDLGLYERMNLGFAEAADGLVSFLGADDLLEEGCVAKVTAAYRASGRRWVAGSVRWVDMEGRHLAVLRPIFSGATAKQHASVGHPLIHISATWMEKSFHQELGGFDPRYPIAAEYDLTTRALASAPFARVKDVLSTWRLSGANLSVSRRREAVEEYTAISRLHGPQTILARLLMRYGNKILFNLANPDYVRGKTINRVRYRLSGGAGVRF